MLVLLNVYTYLFCGLSFSIIRLAAYTYHQGQCQGKSQTRGRTKPVPVIKESRAHGRQLRASSVATRIRVVLEVIRTKIRNDVVGESVLML